jgi:hypothetical protein
LVSGISDKSDKNEGDVDFGDEMEERSGAIRSDKIR